jgi:hypothetical protein
METLVALPGTAALSFAFSLIGRDHRKLSNPLTASMEFVTSSPCLRQFQIRMCDA